MSTNKRFYLGLLLFLFSLNSLCGSIIVAFAGVSNWNTLGETSKFLIVVGILQVWTGTMVAFFTRTHHQSRSPKKYENNRSDSVNSRTR